MSRTEKNKNDEHKNWIQKQWHNILFFIILALFIIPQTRKPIQVTINRMFAFSPSKIDEAEQPQLKSYDWQLKNLNGKVVNLERSRSKPMIINFWATWCPPCIAEMPSMQGLYDGHQDNVDFYFVSNEKRETIRKFTTKHDYELPIYQPLEPQPQTLKASSLPTTYIIDTKGKIHVQKVGAADWNSEEVNALLDELSN